jgi:hypothetical protein
MKLRLDPWPAEYDAPVQMEEIPTGDEARLRVDIRAETEDWDALPPGAGGALRCDFVDGVRRAEARVLGEVDGALVHGLFGGLAAGHVRASGSRAQFGEMGVERFLILGNGQTESFALQVGGAEVHFIGHACARNTPDAVLGELQSLMRAAEARLAESLAADGGCVFVDGLSYRATGRFPVVGVIKRIFDPYVNRAQFALVERLRARERTPLFAILDGTYDRYSCFLRLADPRAVDHPLAGIVRLEIGAAVGIDRARQLASQAAGMLPQFASTTMRDPRAPQNLLPVGALEQELRRRMGDPLTMRRAIEKALHQRL